MKEIYYLIYKSEYKYSTLDCIYRIPGYIQFQTFVLAYTFLKFKRKVKNIPNKYIRLNNSLSSDYNFALFCINKGAGNYNYLNFYKAKIAMEYLFPTPSPYEIVDNSLINLSFNIVYSMNELIKTYENQFSYMLIKNESLSLEKKFIL